MQILYCHSRTLHYNALSSASDHASGIHWGRYLSYLLVTFPTVDTTERGPPAELPHEKIDRIPSTSPLNPPKNAPMALLWEMNGLVTYMPRMWRAVGEATILERQEPERCPQSVSRVCSTGHQLAGPSAVLCAVAAHPILGFVAALRSTSIISYGGVDNSGAQGDRPSPLIVLEVQLWHGRSMIGLDGVVPLSLPLVFHGGNAASVGTDDGTPSGLPLLAWFPCSELLLLVVDSSCVARVFALSLEVTPESVSPPPLYGAGKQQHEWKCVAQFTLSEQPRECVVCPTVPSISGQEQPHHNTSLASPNQMTFAVVSISQCGFRMNFRLMRVLRPDNSLSEAVNLLQLCGESTQVSPSALRCIAHIPLHACDEGVHDASLGLTVLASMVTGDGDGWLRVWRLEVSTSDIPSMTCLDVGHINTNESSHTTEELYSDDDGKFRGVLCLAVFDTNHIATLSSGSPNAVGVWAFSPALSSVAEARSTLLCGVNSSDKPVSISLATMGIELASVVPYSEGAVMSLQWTTSVGAASPVLMLGGRSSAAFFAPTQTFSGEKEGSLKGVSPCYVNPDIWSPLALSPICWDELGGTVRGLKHLSEDLVPSPVCVTGSRTVIFTVAGTLYTRTLRLSDNVVTAEIVSNDATLVATSDTFAPTLWSVKLPIHHPALLLAGLNQDPRGVTQVHNLRRLAHSITTAIDLSLEGQRDSDHFDHTSNYGSTDSSGDELFNKALFAASSNTNDSDALFEKVLSLPSSNCDENSNAKNGLLVQTPHCSFSNVPCFENNMPTSEGPMELSAAETSTLLSALLAAGAQPFSATMIPVVDSVLTSSVKVEPLSVNAAKAVCQVLGLSPGSASWLACLVLSLFGPGSCNLRGTQSLKSRPRALAAPEVTSATGKCSFFDDDWGTEAVKNVAASPLKSDPERHHTVDFCALGTVDELGQIFLTALQLVRTLENSVAELEQMKTGSQERKGTVHLDTLKENDNPIKECSGVATAAVEKAALPFSCFLSAMHSTSQAALIEVCENCIFILYYFSQHFSP